MAQEAKKKQGISVQSFLDCIQYVVDIKKPILIRSRHGVGKSSLVYEYAKKNGYKIIERRASQMTEGDLLGLPRIIDSSTHWAPPEWFLMACREPVVLFIDELDRATLEVRQGFFELADSRKMSGFCLHEGTIIFSAINSKSFETMYQTHELDPAELDRWAVVDLNPTVNDWLLWGRENNNVHEIILKYIELNPDNLEVVNAHESNKVDPSRRSWHHLSNCLTKANFLGRKDLTKEELNRIFNISTFFVGLEISIDFVKFLDSLIKENACVSATEFFACNSATLQELEKYDINNHLRLINSIGNSTLLAGILSPKQADMLAKYLLLLPGELGMKLWDDIGEKSNINNILAIHKYPGVDKYLLDNLTGKRKAVVTENKNGNIKS